MEGANSEAATMADHNIPCQGEFPMKSNDGAGGLSMKPTMNAVELGREMEKEKIREEVIASEMFRRRELEAEVRMELMMEKQILGMRPFNWLSPIVDDHTMLMKYGFLGFQYGRPYFDKSLLNLGISDDKIGERMKLNRHSSGGGDELLQVSENPRKNEVLREGGQQKLHDVALGKWPFERDSSYLAAQFAGKSSAEQAEEEVTGQVMTSSGITGMKRKAETSARACDEETAPTVCKDSQKKWYCSLCEVSATSEVTLDAHFQGKKHKAKEAKSKSKDTASSISMDSNAVDNSTQLADPATTTSSAQEKSSGTKEWECSLCQLSVTSETLLKSHLQGKKHKAKEAKLQNNQNTSDAELLSSEKSQDTTDPASNANATEAISKWYCSLCEVSASSEKNFNDHLQGKKHKARAGMSDKETANADHDSIEKVSEVAKIMKEKNSAGPSSLSTELAEHDEKEQQLTNKSNKKLVFGQAKIELGEDMSLRATPEADDLKDGQTDQSELETSLSTNQNTAESQKRGYIITDHVKYWHCKMCNEGTCDEATMAAHRKGSKHMKLLWQNGGGLICVSSIPKKGVDASEISREEASA